MNNVFVNRTLNLRHIKAIGFDMDHTLVRYHTQQFEALAFQSMVESLVQLFQYPESIRSFKFRPELAIRGLVIDQHRGSLLKLDRFNQIHTSYQGSRLMPYKEQRRAYSESMVDLSESRFLSLDTSFAISLASLYMQLVDLKIQEGAQSQLPEFDEMASHVVKTLDHAHSEGDLKQIVARDIASYIQRDAKIPEGLERMKKHGKFLFIVTNSEFEYAKTLLEYTIDPFLKDHKSWKDLFNLVIMGSQKPRFFYDNLRFLKLNTKNGGLENFSGKLSDGVYQGGNAKRIETDFGFQAHEILYMGDHIYGDILRLKKDCGWRTGLILEELEQETSILKKIKPLEDRIHSLMNQKEPLERQIRDLESEQIESGTRKHQPKIQSLFSSIADLDKELSQSILQIQHHFNPMWGPIMRAGNMESYYAHQVMRFADIYTGNVEAFTSLSPRSYLRAQRRTLPHELD